MIWSTEHCAAAVIDQSALSHYKSSGSFTQDHVGLSAKAGLLPHAAVKLVAPDELVTQVVSVKNHVVDENSLLLLLRALSLSPSILRLELYNAGLSAASLSTVSSSIQSTGVTSLSIDYNPFPIGLNYRALFGQLIGGTSQLRTLSLRGNQLRDDAAQALAAVLDTNTRLATLNLFDNQITEVGLAALVDCLYCNTALAGLCLARNHLCGLAAQAELTRMLCGSTVAASSSLLVRRKEAESCIAAANKAIADAAKKAKQRDAVLLPTLAPVKSGADGTLVPGNTSLQVLNVAENRLGAEHVALLLQSLMSVSTAPIGLQHLHLQRCCAEDAVAEVTAAAAASVMQACNLQVHL